MTQTEELPAAKARQSTKWTRAGLALGLALVWGTCLASEGRGKCDAATSIRLVQAKRSPLSVIIKFAGKPSDAELQNLKSLGADVYRNLPIIDSVAARISAEGLKRLIRQPNVLHVSADAGVRKTDQFTVASSEADVAYQQYGLDGRGVGIAVVDSGVGKQMDFDGSEGNLLSGLLGLLFTRVKAQVNFVPNESPDDLCGHGTHVAGIAAGNGASSYGLLCFRTFYGIARYANIVSVKVLNSQGSGTVSQVVSGIQWCMKNQAAYNIRVINLSLGHPVGESYTTDPLCQAVEAAWKGGIVVVCAAGNDGRLNANPTSGAPNEGYDTNYGSIEVPGNDPYVITVGATKSTDGNRADDHITTYSSRGPSLLDYTLKPDIIAPGNMVISVEQPDAYLVNHYQATNQVPYGYYSVSLTPAAKSNNYFRLSGTSMATPVVAGAAAMMLQKCPGLSPDTVKTRLMVSADKWADASGNPDPCTYGAGYLNIPAALTNTLVATQYAMSPALSFDQSGNVYINFYGNVDLSRAIWGTGTLYDMRAIWGQRAIWGTDTLSSSRAIWGKNFWSDDNTTSISSAGVDLSAGSIWIQGEK